MSRDKQIEEMAKIICRSNRDGICGYDGHHCDFNCGNYQLATIFYNAGYRKSTDVAEEIFAEIEKTFKECLWFLENHPSDYPRMDRTKINVYKYNLQYIAEIKNKYKGE